MKRVTSSGGELRMPYRLHYVLFLMVSGVLVLQLSSWSRVSRSTHCIHSISSNQNPDLVHSAPASVLTVQAAPVRLATANDTSQQQGVAAATALGGPPYSFPKLIHQTVVNKSRLSCEEKRVIESWKKLNPDHTHKLWDDEDMRKFMVEHYPALVPVPYDLFVKGTERSDLWRVLVLHKFGGVYADMDVECLKPIKDWNAEHKHDAAVLLGAENFDIKRIPHRVHVTNWAMAAMPGHPLLGSFAGVVVQQIQKQYFKLAEAEKELTPKLYESGILDRTGPAALTTAMYEYYDSIRFDLNKAAKSEADISGKQGIMAGGVRVLPVVALSSGWEVADARSKGRQYTCADVARDKPQALVCHMFWGSWRSTWRTFKQKFTYDTC